MGIEEMPRCTLGLSVAVGLTGLVVSPTAGAAAGLGVTFDPPQGCGSGTFLQTASPGGQYTVPTAGVITSGGFQGGSAAPPQLKLKVGRPTGGNSFAIVGESAVQNPPTDGFVSFPAQIPVQAGDVIGFHVTAGECARTAPPSTYSMHVLAGDVPVGAPPVVFGGPFEIQLDISATLEPDCDGDGLGDETQDSDIASCTPDTAPPAAAIVKGPKDKTKNRNATFEFTGSDARAVASFQCRLDGGAFAPCSSPHTVKVKKGKHTFSVRAVDQAGNVGPPATDDWKVRKKKKR